MYNFGADRNTQPNRYSRSNDQFTREIGDPTGSDQFTREIGERSDQFTREIGDLTGGDRSHTHDIERSTSPRESSSRIRSIIRVEEDGTSHTNQVPIPVDRLRASSSKTCDRKRSTISEGYGVATRFERKDDHIHVNPLGESFYVPTINLIGQNRFTSPQAVGEGTDRFTGGDPIPAKGDYSFLLGLIEELKSSPWLASAADQGFLDRVSKSLRKEPYTGLHGTTERKSEQGATDSTLIPGIDHKPTGALASILGQVWDLSSESISTDPAPIASKMVTSDTLEALLAFDPLPELPETTIVASAQQLQPIVELVPVKDQTIEDPVSPIISELELEPEPKDLMAFTPMLVNAPEGVALSEGSSSIEGRRLSLRTTFDWNPVIQPTQLTLHPFPGLTNRDTFKEQALSVVINDNNEAPILARLSIDSKAEDQGYLLTIPLSSHYEAVESIVIKTILL